MEGLSFDSVADVPDDVPLDGQQTIASTLFELVLLKENGKFSNGTLTKLLSWDPPTLHLCCERHQEIPGTLLL